MPKSVTIAAKNRYCQARLRAAEYNQKFLSRAGASEELPGVTEDSLKKYELDIVRPSNDVVALMADAYNEPELRNWYCVNECALGRYCSEIAFANPELTAMRLHNMLGTVNKTAERLFQILDDGKVDELELSEIPQLQRDFVSARQRLDEALALMEKLQKGGNT